MTITFSHFKAAARGAAIVAAVVAASATGAMAKGIPTDKAQNVLSHIPSKATGKFLGGAIRTVSKCYELRPDGQVLEDSDGRPFITAWISGGCTSIYLD